MNVETSLVELGYARVSTRKQDLTRQLNALTETGIPEERIWTDKWTAATMARPGWTELRRYARENDVIVVHTLDRLGRNLREVLTAVHELRELGIGVRTLADPLPIDTSDDSPMAQISLSMLALFAEMQRVYVAEQAAHAREVAAQQGKQSGRPRALDGDRLTAALAAFDAGMHPSEVASAHGVGESTLRRYLAEHRPKNKNQDREQG